MSQEEIGSAKESVQQARHYFEHHLPQLLGKLLLKDVTSLTCWFDVCFLDDALARYGLAIVEGRLITVGHASGAPEVVYSLDAEALLDIITARVTPQDAFYDMRVEISGDIELGLELGAVFEEFFRFRPHNLKAVAYERH